ncbi:MAG: hypothetical protein IPM81_03065 [Saprospirales bacterium]|nr:hypothetical protein [Saprospirales bacterium]
MDKIFHSTFDFFSHAIPGFCVLSSFFILDPTLQDAQQFLKLASQMNIGSGVFVLVLSYLTGFAINPIGRKIYKRLGFLLFENKFHKDYKLFISDKFILIREFSPNNFKYVETWNMFCAMAHNLAVASLFVLCITLIKINWQHPGNIEFWRTVAGLSLVFFILFLHRAVKFYKWAGDDLNAALWTLQLEERARHAAAAASPQK